MITTSEAISKALMQNGRRFKNCLVFEDSDGNTDKTIYNLISLKIDKSLVQGDDYTIGGTYMAKMTCVIPLGIIAIEDLTPRKVNVICKVQLEDGTYGNLRQGVFYTTEAKRVDNTVHITGYDGICKLHNHNIDGHLTSEDWTVSKIMTELASRSGLTYTGANFDYNPVIPAKLYNGGFDFKYTYLDLIQWLATVCSANVVCDEYGRLTMRRPQAIDYKDITKDDYSEFTFDSKPQKITGLKVENRISNLGFAIFLGDETGKVMLIKENPLLMSELSQNVYDTLRKLTFRTFSVKLPLGDPRIELGDTVYIRDYDEAQTRYTCHVLQQTIDLSGGCTMELSASINPFEEGFIEYSGSKSIEIENLVDKVKKLKEDFNNAKNENVVAFEKCLKKGEEANVSNVRSKSAWLHNVEGATQNSVTVISRNGTGKWRVLLNADDSLSFSVYDGQDYKQTPIKLNRDGSVTVGGNMESTNCKFSKAIIGDNETCEMSMPSSNTWQLKVENGSYSNAIQFVQNGSNDGGILRPLNTDKVQLGQASYKWTGVYATNTSIQSDRKVKRDIEDIEDAQKFIMSLRPRQYKMQNSDTENGRLHYGFVAQEVNEVATDIMKKDLSMCRASYVTHDKDGKAVDNYFKDGLSDEALSWYLDYNELISPLVAFVQSQYKQIEELKKEIKLMKGEL